MSLRTLKKLRGETDLQQSLNDDDQSRSESEDGSDRAPQPNVSQKKKKQLTANPFALLEGVGNSPSDTEAKEDDDKDGTSTAGQCREKVLDAEATKLIEETKHKNKKRRKSRLNKQKSSEIVLEEDEIDASIREVNKILGVDVNAESAELLQAQDQQSHSKNILSISHKHLNPNNEMKKIFGSRVVHAEQSKKRGRHRSHSKATWLVAHRSTWPQLERHGLSMSIDENDGGISRNFRFDHNKQYQLVQFQFLDAVESFNPENITALLRLHPYHVDALIQLSDACKIGEDIQIAAELIERAIYSLESSFHPLFNITQGTCRLSYKNPENRSFFVALFKHINFIGQKGCYRTALEFSKLLLSLDPDGDPLSALLFIDFYAIKSGSYDFLLRLFNEWEAARNLSKLTNFAFSVPLAKFHLSKEEGMQHLLAEADEFLQKSLMMFPSLLFPLLDKCGIQPDSEVSSHEFFSRKTNENVPASLKLLIHMYVTLCSPLWKEMDVVEWLEKNVKLTLSKIQSHKSEIEGFKAKIFNSYRAKMPLNICRYVILSETTDTFDALPQEIVKSPGASYDPVPPPDSIISYTRPTCELQSSTRNENVLSLFFRTMMPNFNTEQQQGRRDPLLAMLDYPRVDNAAENNEGATGGAGQNLQRSVNSLLDAIRDLLSNIHMPELPRDGDGDDEDSDDERED